MDRPMQVPDGSGSDGWRGTPILWLAASAFFLAEALVIPESWGWPWLVAAIVCQVESVRRDPL